MIRKKLSSSCCVLKEWIPAKYFARLATSAKLEPIGIFEPTLEDKQYVTGQLFLHRVFGYRGIILTPWEVKVYDRDATPMSRTFLKTVQEKNPVNSGQTDDKIGSRSGSFSKTNPDEVDKNSKSFSKDKGEEELSSPGVNVANDSSSGANQQQVCPTPPSNYQQKKMNSLFKPSLYYSVLMDERDWKHVKYRTQTEGVTFLHESEDNSPFFTIPGLDYVCHSDVMPYSSLSLKPIQHNLLDKFISYEPTTEPPFVARQALTEWTGRNKFWLEPTDVYKETTNDIRVTVVPFYMGCKRKSDPGQQSGGSLALSNYSGLVQQYWWRYCIRVENVGTQNVQLCERNWRIFSMNGSLETVRARGVNGVEPMLSMDVPAFQYSSHVSLYTPSGHMWGTFRIRTRTGKAFDVKVPPFTLESRSAIKDYSSTDGNGTD